MAFMYTQEALKCSANRHTTALGGCLDRSTYHSIWWGWTASSEMKNTASTHLQQKKIKTVTYTVKLKAYGLGTWAYFEIRQQYAECRQEDAFHG